MVADMRSDIPPLASIRMFTIRDAIWLMLLGAMAVCWYADRSVSENSIRNLRRGLEIKDYENRNANRQSPWR
jgi:hypothetical protein